MAERINAETRDRTGDLQIFSLTLSQLSYRGYIIIAIINDIMNGHDNACWNDQPKDIPEGLSREQ